MSETTQQQDIVARWLRPLALVVLGVVVWTTVTGHPGPGGSGTHLVVSIALGGCVLGGLGSLAIVRRARVLHLFLVITLLAASATLMWLAPQGVGVAGIFVGVSFLAPILRRHRSIPVIVVLLCVLAVVVGGAQHGNLGAALLTSIMIGAFYGMTFLALRLGEANQRAESLVLALEESQAAQAEAVGLAERQRLAREMHDVLAHSLSGLILQLEGARMLAVDTAPDPRLAQAIHRAHQLGRNGLDEARRAIGMLRDDDLPGPEGIAELARQFQHDRGIRCDFTMMGTLYPVRSEAKLALYRVAQEALTNIAKHAQPDRVEVCLTFAPSLTRLVVEDFAVTERRPSLMDGGGYGLTGMRERAELLGGTLIASPAAHGFRVELEIPR